MLDMFEEEPAEAAAIVFGSSTGRATQEQELYRTPGPAHYEVLQKDRSVSLGDPSFRSGLHRLEGLRSKSQVPGPGQYDVVPPHSSRRSSRAGPNRPRFVHLAHPRRRVKEEEKVELCVTSQAFCRRLICGRSVEEQRLASRKRMKSLLMSHGDSIPSSSRVDEVIWIGTHSKDMPSKRPRPMGKVVPPSSAFASGTARSSVFQREEQPGPSPADFIPSSPFDERPAHTGMQAPFGARSARQPAAARGGSPDLGPGCYDLDVPLRAMLEHRRSPSPVFRSPQFGALHREECRTPGPGDYRDAAHIAWEEASTQAPSSAAASTTPPLGFGSRTDRACAISTPPIDEREVIPPDPLRRLNVMTRRALRLAHEGLHRPCSPAPGDYGPCTIAGEIRNFPPGSCGECNLKMRCSTRPSRAGGVPTCRKTRRLQGPPSTTQCLCAAPRRRHTTLVLPLCKGLRIRPGTKLRARRQTWTSCWRAGDLRRDI
ncbi:unnamed protein product [Durusdinium trenchii]|uniref:Uncharacterized protein n=1 Tax=Durusdinium trenchii TaxID=1381693 RepID=A0ABP0LZY6_9DINO